MRKEIIIIVLISLFCFKGLASSAQTLPNAIQPYQINISYNKTTNLIFPYAVKSVDRGCNAILAQKAIDVENILQLKAGEIRFKETNVTVVTSDNHFYSFVVNYVDSPIVLNYSFVRDSNETVMIKNQPLSEASMQTIANSIEAKHPSLHKWIREGAITLSIDNLFIKDDLLWIKLSLHNESAISFMPSYLRLFLQNERGVKRTAVQENELLPVYATPFEKISAGNKKSIIVTLKLFTIPTTKKLVIQVGEEAGSRLMVIKLNHRMMHKIRTL